VTIEADCRVRDAMKILKQHNILSAPVYDSQEKGYIGLIDLIDIVNFITKSFTHADLSLGEGFASIMEQAEILAKTEVKEVTDISQRNPFVPVSDNITLFKVAEVMAKERVRRVPIFNKEGKLVNLVTQSAVVSLLAHHIGSIGPIANKTVQELGIGTHPVTTIDISRRVIDAFNIINEQNISAVVVVNNLIGGQVVATISVKDIRDVTKSPADLQRLYDPISAFLQSIHDSEIDVVNPTITCRNESTLTEVMTKLASSRIHRLWIVDRQNRPEKCISLRDILLAIIEH